jgi:hypothetical protein
VIVDDIFFKTKKDVLGFVAVEYILLCPGGPSFESFA